MLFNKLSVLFICLYIVFVYSQAQPSTITLQGTVFDQHPFFNQNFENAGGGLVTGMVKKTIDTENRVPLLASTIVNIPAGIVNPSQFEYFFKPNQNAPSTRNSAKNIPIPHEIVLNWNEASGVYTYSSSQFFPIDNKGFETPEYASLNLTKYTGSGGTFRNFHFCFKINSKFTFKGYEIFSFTGDDDVWVFINDKLEVDLGGVHSPLSGMVDLKTLGLTVGSTYNFDFFICERHTTGSSMSMTTNIEVVCPEYDYCGVCQGDGLSCCTAETTCNDGDKCTIDSCPIPSTVIEAGKNISSYCTHTPILPSIDPNNKCIINQCNPSTGNVDPVPVQCIDKSNECLINNGCNSLTGTCQYESSCNNVCNNGLCNNGTCAIKSSNDCAFELDGENQDKCSVYSCDSNGAGCVKEAKCKPNPNKCFVTSCSADSGECIDTPVENPFEGNVCVISSCDIETGLYNATPIECPDKSNECLYGLGCDSTLGCQYESSCNNVCDSGLCGNGTCIVKSSNDCAFELDGENQDKCSVYSCDSNGAGCVKEAKCKPNPNKCFVTSCSADSGECIDTPVANPFENDSCLVGYCDPNTGLYSSTPYQCPDKSNECLVNTGCKSKLGGCQYKSSCSSPQDNKCQQSICRFNTTSNQGYCSIEFRSEINDNNPCTIDDCDPCTGIITHTQSKMCKPCKKGGKDDDCSDDDDHGHGHGGKDDDDCSDEDDDNHHYNGKGKGHCKGKGKGHNKDNNGNNGNGNNGNGNNGNGNNGNNNNKPNNNGTNNNNNNNNNKPNNNGTNNNNNNKPNNNKK